MLLSLSFLIPLACLAQGYGSYYGTGTNGVGWNPSQNPNFAPYSSPLQEIPESQYAPPSPGNLAQPNGSFGLPAGAMPQAVMNGGITPDWQNRGITNVIAAGYDAQGDWRTIPLTVKFVYNGAYYQVTVLNAWNPWSHMWNRGVDQPAYATQYYLRGGKYDYYTNLGTGTYYFNL